MKLNRENLRTAIVCIGLFFFSFDILEGDPVKCCVCSREITSEPFKIFGDLNYCFMECWSNGWEI